MLKQRPLKPHGSPQKLRKEARHWSAKVQESIISSGAEGTLNFVVRGGAENGQFCYVGELKQDRLIYHSGRLHQYDIILEVQGQKVSGFILKDLLDYIKHVGKNGAPVILKTVRAGELSYNLYSFKGKIT